MPSLVGTCLMLQAYPVCGSLKHGHDCAQHMLMRAEPIRAVAAAAVDVIGSKDLQREVSFDC